MKKFFTFTAAAILAVTGTSAAVADPGDGIVTSGPYSHIFKYYNASQQLVGYTIHYCDGSTESYREPGQNFIFIDIEEGTCLGDLPLPGGL